MTENGAINESDSEQDGRENKKPLEVSYKVLNNPVTRAEYLETRRAEMDPQEFEVSLRSDKYLLEMVRKVTTHEASPDEATEWLKREMLSATSPESIRAIEDVLRIMPEFTEQWIRCRAARQ